MQLFGEDLGLAAGLPFEVVENPAAQAGQIEVCRVGERQIDGLVSREGLLDDEMDLAQVQVGVHLAHSAFGQV